LLEAVKADTVDFALFAEAGGAQLLYIGHEPAAPEHGPVCERRDTP
jgi:hypothetical protein